MNKQSELVKAMQGWNKDLKTFSNPPKGMFGRECIVKTWLVTLNGNDLDIEFDTKFDDDTEANEAEIRVYNLSAETIKLLHYNDNITIEAGYKGDTGLIFDGYISSVKTKWEGVDKITTIKALDNKSLKERDIAEKTYKAGTTASYILKDLINMLSLPLAVFKVRRDHTYKEEEKVSGGIMSNIKKYAEICGISVYINQRKIYARHLSEGDNINFIVNSDTGLIGSPEEFEEEIAIEDGSEIIKGYKFKMLLQHQLTTAAIIKLQSRDVQGTFRVRAGQHTYNDSEAVTEAEVI